MRSCLEIRSMDARHEMETRSDYNRNNEYYNNYVGAIGEKDTSWKGRTDISHGHWLPNCNGTIGTFNYSNFDTAIESNLGNIADNRARNEALTRSVYTPQNPYGSIDTSMNVLEGQYQVK